MELFLADFVNVPEYVEKFLSVPRPWSQHEYILCTPALNTWKSISKIAGFITVYLVAVCNRKFIAVC